jgi:HSP20 family protein
MNAVVQQEDKSVRPQPVDAAREFVTPQVNIVENPDGYVLEAELPGVNKEGLEISQEDNVLTIVGRRQPGPAASLLYRESRTGDFRRVFELDPSIDSAKIAARIEQGILTLNLPKAEKVKPRKIAVS